MPSFVVKPDRDKDEYVVWSTIVDMPGPPHPRPEDPDPETASRYDRADRNGTSAMFGGHRASEQPFSWDQTEFSIGWPTYCPDEHDALVKRSDLPELGRRAEAGTDTRDLTRFVPRED